jgi:threonyl-tRNA synthetase
LFAFTSSGTAEDQGEKKRPVIIHRAILGSVERMIAILCENYGGKWPFWLSPRQAIVIPIAPAFDEYAIQVNKPDEVLLE